MALKSAQLTDAAAREHVPRRPRDLNGLLQQLNADAAGQRRWAARDLAGHPDAVPGLVQRLQVEREPAVCEAILTSLSLIGGPTVAAALVPMLASHEAHLRNGALEVLSALPEAVAPHIDPLLTDPDPDLRLLTVQLAGGLRHPRVADWLAAVLRDECDVNVVAAALDVVAMLGDGSLRSAVEAARQRLATHPFIAFAADLALVRMEAA